MEFADIRKRNRVIIYFLYLFCLAGFCVLFAPDYEIDSIYTRNYWIDALYLFFCSIFFGWEVCTRKFDLFSPITTFSVLYIIMFFFIPIYDISIGEVLWFGQDLFGYGIKASTIAFVGYMSFFAFYKAKFSYRRSLKNKLNNEKRIRIKGKMLVPVIVVGYMICLLANIYYMVFSNGNSILYILTLGMAGSSGQYSVGENIGVISMLSYSLPSFTLLYVEYGKRKIFKIVFFALMFVLQVARGFRFFIIQIIIMFGAYYFLRKKKKPRIRNFVVLGICVMIPVILMTLFRNGIRAGRGMDFSIVNSESIVEALDAAIFDNFRIYKTYYGLIKAVPKMTNYLYGRQMLVYTVVMLIPRAIWHGKPGNPGTKAQFLALGKAVIDGGSAYPGLGEYYYDSGIIGVIIWSAIFGLWLSKMQRRYRYSAETPVDLMVYSTILGLILQFVIRGYTPSNFWLCIFCMIPYWSIKKIFSVREKV